MIWRMQPDFSDRNTALGALYADHLATVCRRYDDALQKAGKKHALIFSGSPHPVFLDDCHYPYKAAANFLCWLPQTSLPHSYVSYTPGEKPVLIYYQPKDYWHVVPGEPDGYWVDSFDIRVVHEQRDIQQHLPASLTQSAFIGEALNADVSHGIEALNPKSVLNALDFARGRKTPYELECMRLANHRGVAGHTAAHRAFLDGCSEVEIHRAYCAAVEHLDSELPYGNIIALNEHAAVLHYTALDREAPKSSRSFLIDAGAQVHGYASDITRTYCSDSDSTFSSLIDAMDGVQQRILKDVRAGVDYPSLHVRTHLEVARVLLDFDLASGSTEALVESKVTSAFYPHGLGHLLGAQVHDVGGHMLNETGIIKSPPAEHPFLRLTRVLGEDMVITIEPGLYFIDLLLDQLKTQPAASQVNWKNVEALKPYGGIRIEDDVRVRADGIENFTRDAFNA